MWVGQITSQNATLSGIDRCTPIHVSTGPIDVLSPHLDTEALGGFVGRRVRWLSRHQHAEGGLATRGRAHHANLEEWGRRRGRRGSYRKTSPGSPSFSHVEGGGREVPGGRTRNATHLAVINVCERNDIDVDFGGMIDAREGV